VVEVVTGMGVIAFILRAPLVRIKYWVYVQ